MKQKGFAQIIIVLLGIALVALGYYIFKQNLVGKILNYSSVPKESLITPTPPGTPTTPAPSPTNSQTPTSQPAIQPTSPPATPTESEPVYWPAPEEESKPGKSKQVPFVGG